MLDLDTAREGAVPRDAATLVLVRDAAGGGVEIFCVERHKKSGFLGGAIVFPGGKLDDRDRDPAWRENATAPRTPQASSATSPFAPDEDTLRALAVAACRETLEEAALLPIAGAGLNHEELLAMRAKVAAGESLFALLSAGGHRLDLAALHPFARWITPVAEARRFDARFFLATAVADARGAHDERETTSSFWATPQTILDRFARGEIQLAPPTHRTVELLGAHRDVSAALAWSATSCLDPICPKLVRQGDTLALALPGDPEHDVRESRVAGKSRFVMRGDRWMPEDAPA